MKNIDKSGINSKCLPRSRSGLLIFISCVVILVIGVSLNSVVVEYAEKNENRHFLEFINAVAPYLDPTIVSTLTGTSADLKKPQFRQIKEYLSDLRATNLDYRFAYLMGKSDNNIVFLADAEDETSPDYSAPGEVYGDASEQLHEIFSDGKSFIEGPVTDSYGEWVSAHAPIYNNGKVIAIIGIDISAKEWKASFDIYRLFSISITFLIAIIIVIFLRSILKISRSRDKIYVMNLGLRDALAQVKTLEGIITICMNCRKIRNDEKTWQRVEEYIAEHTDADFSHGMCPDCFETERGKIKKMKEQRIVGNPL